MIIIHTCTQCTYIQNNNTLHIHATVAMHVLLTLPLLECLRTVYVYLRVCHYAQHSALKCVAFYLWSYSINMINKHQSKPQFKAYFVL